MARIRTTRKIGGLCIHLAGRLTANDLGRLEHACGRALEANPLRIELDLASVTSMDPTAAAFVARMVHRGATLVDSATRTRPPSAETVESNCE